MQYQTEQQLPQAASEPLPELVAFLEPFRPFIARSEGFHAMERYLTGLLSEIPTKNCDTIAQSIPNTHAQALQHLLTGDGWDEEAVNWERVQTMRRMPTDGDGALVLDATGFLKKGTKSVGVARQYTGTAGKVENCQVAVTCVYAERTTAWPVTTRLYLPEDWANDPTRRAEVHIPESVTFQTKPEIALDLVDQARDMGVPYTVVTVDGGYGDVPSFLDGLEIRDELYIAAVHRNFTVSLQKNGTEPQRADQVIRQQPVRTWRLIRWREGTKGPLKAYFVAVPCWRQDDLGDWRKGWLVAERPPRGSSGPLRYYWSNFLPETPLETLAEYAHRRFWVERFHEDGKELLGWDDYQGRRWDGFHRHAILVMIALSFLIWQEWHQREQQRGPGRPRGASSPRQDRRRVSLASIQRKVVDWLRVLALLELSQVGDLFHFRPLLC
jgi:SRSO17 transposase